MATTSSKQAPSEDVRSALSLGERFIQALVERTPDHLERCLADGVRFRALTPNHVWAHFGTAAVTSAAREWFGNARSLTIMHQEVNHVGDRLSLRYRLRVEEAMGTSVCEQHAYCVMENDVITDISLVCSGFIPI
jgi:hypothetical protein